MKEMKSTTEQKNREVYYDNKEYTLVIDGVRIKYAANEQSRNFTESNFTAIPCRDRSIEQLLTIARAMLIDYHYHHRIKDDYDLFDCTYRRRLVDENPQESIAILLEVEECCRIIMERIFQGDWTSQTGYIGLVISLMGDVLYSFENFDMLYHSLKNFHLFHMDLDDWFNEVVPRY